MSLLVSIIMPVYNGEQYIREAIQSVFAQTYPHWELLVIDDGSTDGTAGIVSTFDDPRIRYVYGENQGQAAALNHGLDAAHGEYMTTLDADDIFPSTSLAARVTWLDGHPEYGAVYGDGYYCNEMGNPVLRFANYRKVTPIGDVYDYLIESPFFCAGANVMQRRSILQQHHIRYDDTIVWCQDWDFYIRLAEKTMFGYVDAVTVQYRLHSMNMTVTMPEGRRLESLIRTKRTVLSSSRFATVPVKYKSEFFYTLLVTVLHDRVADQMQTIEDPSFQQLPESEQSRLLRLMATQYLLEGRHLQVVRQWLHRAWRLSPWQPKTMLLAVASAAHMPLAKAAVEAWRSSQGKGEAMPSPFQLASLTVNEY